jgi:hypothetical protein
MDTQSIIAGAKSLFYGNDGRLLDSSRISAALLKRADAVLAGKVDSGGCLDAISFRWTTSSTRWSESGKEITFSFDVPLACSLVGDPSDISDDILQYYLEEIDKYIGTKLEYGILRLGYAVSSCKHFDSKHVAHCLLEQGNLMQNPNKVTLCKKFLSIEQVRNILFIQYEYREEWKGPNTGVPCYSGFTSYQSMLDSAVASGNPENVRFALENGCSLPTIVPDYGGSTMAQAARFSWKPEYRAISMILIEEALKQGILSDALQGRYRYGRTSTSVICYFARYGHIDLVLLCGNNDAGEAITETISHKDKYTQNTGNWSTITQNGSSIGGAWNQGAVFTRSHTWFSFAIVGRETTRYLKQAVVSNLHGDGKYFGVSTFDKCVTFVGLNVPEETSEAFVAFCFRLRECIQGEIMNNNPDFFKETDEMTESFKKRAESEFAMNEHR